MAYTQNFDDISEFPKEAFEDKDFMMLLVKNNGWTLEFTSQELKKDRELVFLAVKN